MQNTCLRRQARYKRGFTLVEVLVSVGIFLLTIIAISQIFISVIRSEKLAYTLLNSENNIRNNLELMARAIRMGTKFEDLNADINKPITQICFVNNEGQEQCFEFKNNSLYQRLSGEEQPLIDFQTLKIKIKQGSFYIMTSTDLPQSTIIIQILAETTYQNNSYEFKVETAVTPRNLQI